MAQEGGTEGVGLGGGRLEGRPFPVLFKHPFYIKNFSENYVGFPCFVQVELSVAFKIFCIMPIQAGLYSIQKIYEFIVFPVGSDGH